MNRPNLEPNPTGSPNRCISRMQLPSVLDFSFRTMSTLPDIAPTGFSPFPHSLQPTPTHDGIESELSFTAPLATNPNNPYFPWDLQERNTILQPVSYSSRAGRYSLPLPPTESKGSESIHFLPEPPRTGSNFLRVSRNIRNIKSAVKKNVAKYITSMHLKKARSTHTKFDDENLDSFNHSPASFDSAETNTLATWLESCQRAQEDDSREMSQYGSFDEYEVAGSWLDLSRHPYNNRNTLNSPMRLASNPVLIDTSFSHQPFSMRWLQDGQSISCPSTPITMHSYIISSTPRDSDLKHSLRNYRSFEDRVGSPKMPGGWTFNGSDIIV